MMRIAIVGCGKQAEKHIRGFRTCSGVELVLADKELAIARELGEKEGVPWLRGPDELYADPAVDAIDICVPTPAHAGLIKQALAANKDFFCEKPLCQTLDEAQEIERLTRESGRTGMTGFIYRFAPVLERGREIMGDAPTSGVSPVLGKLTCATMRIGGRGSHAMWKHRKADGGGAITEMLVHMIDLTVWYIGRIRKAELLIEDLLRPRRVIQGREVSVDAEDFVVVSLVTETGVPVLIQADLVTPSFTQLVEVQGDNGSFMGSIQSEIPSYVYTLSEAGGYRQGRTDITAGPVNIFEAQMAGFADAVRLRQQPSRGTVEDAVHVMEVLEMIRSAPAPSRRGFG